MEIRAKVRSETEPAELQMDAYDNSVNRATSVTIDEWSMGSGKKYWEGLTVRPVAN